MPFNPNTNLNASELQGKFKDAFDYTNVKLSTHDFLSGSIITEDLGRGDFIAVVPDHFFMSGDHLSSGRAKATKIDNDMTYNTATIKTFNPRDRVQYVSQAGCARSFYAEKTCRALITISGWTQDFENANARAVVSEGSSDPLLNVTSVAVDSRWYLQLNGNIVDNTVNRSFEEDSGGSPTALSCAVGENDFAAFERRRRRLHITRLVVLSEGWNIVGLVTDSRNEISRLGNFNISVEVFYDTGLEESAITNLPLTVKIKDTPF